MTTPTQPELDSHVIPRDLAIRVQIELGGIRDDFVNRRMERVDTDRLSQAQVDDIRTQHYLKWNEYHPGLTELWFKALRHRRAQS